MMYGHVPEGLNICIEAPQRRGKTLLGVMLAYDMLPVRKIFSNIQLGFAHERLEFEEMELQDGSRRFWNSFVFIDELNFFFDARISGSKRNRAFGAYLLQQKKQGAHLVGTTHSLDYLDLRYRQNYDLKMIPEVYPAYPAPPEIITVKIENGPLQGFIDKTIRLPCKDYLGLYDSFAIYNPFRALENDTPIKGRGSRVQL